MAAGGNGGQTPKLVRFWPWFYTIAIVVIVLSVVLFNPGNTFRDGQVIPLGWLRFQIYPGQSTALQLMGTFIAAIGVMASLIERRLTGKVPPALSIPAMVGALVVMIGLAIQDLPENYVAPAVLGALLVFIATIWLLAAAWAGLKWFYSWLKSRRKSGG